MILEYLKVLLSAPPLLSLVAVVFIYKFAGDIRELMSRVARIRLPGGAEVATQQSRRVVSGEPTTPPNTDEIPVQGIPSGLTPAQEQDIASLVRSHIATARLWEYRYLNYFLARATQLTLDWFVGLVHPVTYGHYDSFFLPIVSSTRERQAMITALETHRLITLDHGSITVTPKGREYHQWRGELPPLPNTSSGPT